MLTPTRLLRQSWSSTLRLPKSSFPARPSPSTLPTYLHRCTTELYAWQQTARSSPGHESFILHDGPPYANGPLHIGHALNKITKDIVNRFEVSRGKKVEYIPGWDCHGLPIEIKALQASKQDRGSADAVAIRKSARQLAACTVEEQMQGFKEWGVMGGWERAYRTMDKEFEVRQLGVFRDMWEKGLVYRMFKPVYWSPSSGSALAEAELEYDEGHESLAAWVRFPVVVESGLREGGLKGVEGLEGMGELGVVVWTTTPWTLPANKAVAVHKDMEYCVVQESGKEDRPVIIAASRVEQYKAAIDREVKVVLSGLRGSDLAEKLHYLNPFQEQNGLQPLLHADFVSDSSGTGLVHMAPGHGMDDYQVCLSRGIPAFAPVDDAGALTKEAFPAHPELLEGKLVQESGVSKHGKRENSANVAIVEYLFKKGMLQAVQTYKHKYPIDWRTKQPVIVRATEQWFADIDGIKESAMKAIEGVRFLPDGGRSRLESFVQGRSQWCISRQRAWGVPIPTLYRVDSGKLEATMDAEIIENIINVIKEHGTDSWWTDPPDDPKWVPKHLTGTYVRGKDTMDVWFDSGTSWTLLPQRKDQPVADVYLEGTDQHRGWFQSSLLTHVATQTSSPDQIKAPYKTLITHGFTLDSDGRKMSKSLGNVISPSQIMSGELLPPLKRKKQKGAQQNASKEAFDAMGSDALRLWVASSDYTRDVTIGQPVLQSVNQALHKYRVTFKWILGILSLPSCPPLFTSFNDLRAEFSRDPPITQMTDKLALHRLAQVSADVHTHYTKYEFFKGVNAMNKYIANDLSAFYFETLKDRIYTGDKHDAQLLQKMLGVIAYELLQMLSPIVPLLVEEVWAFMPEALRDGSIHPARTTWTPLTVHIPDGQMLDQYQEYVNTLSGAIKAAQERLRTEKKMGSGLECDVMIAIPEDGKDLYLPIFFQDCQGGDLAGMFVVSGVEVREWEDFEGEWAARRREMEMERERENGKGVWWAEEEFRIGSGDGEAQGGRIGRALVTNPSGHKCPRCWRYQAREPETLCGRCEDVVKEEGL
ncbi:isoleucyl-tRNA synthetase-like protein [Amniculicola lignicola CBS 123094]|uniref:Isoleucine--tRNA ligase, mitochondrial n=1 Tax=Amniculicola lignicola CBS 123094 TaxID=1392246 RepID=A0A6A5X332_9PLEO|nr:isoleucyl-tRNA synthetase-like protein [Amniculicola lignicola CBS 123094]